MSKDVTGLQPKVRTVFVDSVATSTVSERYVLGYKFRKEAGMCISIQAVRSRLHEFGFNASRLAIPLPLTKQHLPDRLDFARTQVR